MNLLNEEIYRRKETDLIDAEFKKLISFLMNSDIKKLKTVDLNIKFERELRNIEKLVFNLMNAKIILKVDDSTSFKRLSYGMMIFPSMQEVSGKIRDCIENEKEGFYLRDCSNVLIVIDQGLLGMVRHYGLNEKHLTSVLLHELGHKIYIKKQRELYYDNDNTNAIIRIFGMLISVPLGLVNIAIPIVFLFASYLVISTNSEKTYASSEHLSDLIAVKYGYGTEMFEILNIFYKNSKDKRFKRAKLLNDLLNSLNVSKMRRDKVINALKQELNDSKNSKEEKKIIKKALEEMKKMEV